MVAETAGYHDCRELYLNIAEVDKLPPLEARTDSEVHVLHRRAVLPPSGLIDGGDAPHASGPWTRKRIRCREDVACPFVKMENAGCEAGYR
jgi:hypothetical protein